jgi:hypothetical protein
MIAVDGMRCGSTAGGGLMMDVTWPPRPPTGHTPTARLALASTLMPFVRFLFCALTAATATPATVTATLLTTTITTTTSHLIYIIIIKNTNTNNKKD